LNLANSLQQRKTPFRIIPEGRFVLLFRLMNYSQVKAVMVLILFVHCVFI